MALGDGITRNKGNKGYAYQKGYEQGKQFVLDKVIKLKNEYVDTCNMCLHTRCDTCIIDEFIGELNGIISQ